MALSVVVSAALFEIGKLLCEEGHSLGAVSGKLELLEREMKRMQCFLEDADKRTEDENKKVRLWVSEIRELACDIEDVIATFLVKVASRRRQGLWNKCKRYATIFIEGAHLHKLGNEIEAINGKLTAITNSLQTYAIKFNNGDEGSTSTSHKLQQQLLRRTCSDKTKDHTVGLINDTKVLLKQLVGNESKKSRVISICGMGGIGKSTLARKLYHHHDVQLKFRAFAWLCLSPTFSTRDVLVTTFIKLARPSKKRNEEIKNMDVDEVAKELSQFQKRAKCLVILDDIWTEEGWDKLKRAFPVKSIAGMIVLTTRSNPLGLHVDPECYIHKSRILSPDESWELFENMTFRKREYEAAASMKKIGREMVEECSGLPLAIIALGGILATKLFFNQWMSVRKNVNSHREIPNLEAILALSYSELPYHLKPCLLHVSLFPENYSISSKMMFRLWIGEGIVVKKLRGNETLEDIAEGYLQELVDRCVVQIEQIGSSGRIKTCRLHGLIRQLSLSTANQESYLETIETKTKHTRARRVAVYSMAYNDISFEKKSRVRSLIGPFDLKTLVIGDFKMLRVLSLVNCPAPKKWINEIVKLLHLKYLSLDNCGIEYLPLSLGNIKYLQTLVLKTDYRPNKLVIPNGIWNFQELRHLHVEWRNKHDDTGEVHLKLGNLKSLQILRTEGSVYVEELEKLPSLLNLTASLEKTGLTKVVKSGCLNSLAILQVDFSSNSPSEMLCEIDSHELIQGCGKLEKLRLKGMIENLPTCHQFSPYLAKVILRNSLLKEDPMPVLEKLPHLSFLDLSVAFCGRNMVCSSEGFLLLKTLRLIGLYNLVDWRVDEGSMASLCTLRVDHCKKLEMIPEGIKFIGTLSQFDIDWMPVTFTKRLKVIDGEEGEDYYKVRHVPSINITYRD